MNRENLNLLSRKTITIKASINSEGLNFESMSDTNFMKITSAIVKTEKYTAVFIFQLVLLVNVDKFNCLSS